MAETEDTWPLPKYNPGSRKHLHALGVIAVCYAAFERGVDELYMLHPTKQKLPPKLTSLYYFSLNEERRLAAIKEVFDAYEKDTNVKAAIGNLLEYFQWCRDVRNNLLHAEHYPALFGGDPETLHLTKREGKREPKQVYVALGINRLRSIADKIQEGRRHCASLRIYLRARDTPIYELSTGLKAHAHEPLAETLTVPRPLKLRPRPPNPPMPTYLRGRFYLSAKSD